MRATILLAGLAMIMSPAMASDPGDAGKPGAGKERMVCKREVPIGSLIASRKRCMTKEQWDKLSQDHNDEARRMQMEFATRSRGELTRQHGLKVV